jgi:hypothetical protein
MLHSLPPIPADDQRRKPHDAGDDAGPRWNGVKALRVVPDG